MTTLLVIDPDLLAFEELRNALDEHDWRCIHRTSFEAARQTLQEQTPDIVVTEADLPDGDGFQLCQQVTSDADRGDVAVVFLTQRDELQDKLRALRLGADDYLTKPFQGEEAALRLLALRRRQQSLGAASRVDPVTGLLSREACLEHLDRETERFRRYNRGFAVVLFRAEPLRAIREANGQDAVHAVLKKLGETLRGDLRAADLVGRYQEDEFLTVLPEQSGSDAAAAALRVQRDVEDHPVQLPGGGSARIALRYAVATFDGEDVIDSQRLLAAARRVLDPDAAAPEGSKS